MHEWIHEWMACKNIWTYHYLHHDFPKRTLNLRTVCEYLLFCNYSPYFDDFSVLTNDSKIFLEWQSDSKMQACELRVCQLEFEQFARHISTSLWVPSCDLINLQAVSHLSLYIVSNPQMSYSKTNNVIKH